ncbi:MAG: metallophosphoesterase [Deltaproteobacteria bacterium]|nr:metallophosphoesterase [Deltaproteobacteria bacterium]
MRLEKQWMISRRDFLKTTIAAGLSATAFGGFPRAVFPSKGMRFGIVTDSHYAEADPQFNRYFRESIEKMNECVELMNKQKVDFLIELGDFKDQNTPPVEQKTISYLQAIERCFQEFKGPTYHVLGNHDVDSISKKQYLKNITNTGISTPSTYYSFDRKGIHFIVLDANFLEDGTDYDHGNYKWNETFISDAELDWLRKDLAGTDLPCIVFSHQQLGGMGMTDIQNAETVRTILQESDKVLAGFDGHNHNGGHNKIEGIHYYTLKAMVDGSGMENSSYAIVEIMPDRNIVVTGYRKALSQDFSKTS